MQHSSVPPIPWAQASNKCLSSKYGLIMMSNSAVLFQVATLPMRIELRHRTGACISLPCCPLHHHNWQEGAVLSKQMFLMASKFDKPFEGMHTHSCIETSVHVHMYIYIYRNVYTCYRLQKRGPIFAFIGSKTGPKFEFEMGNQDNKKNHFPPGVGL